MPNSTRSLQPPSPQPSAFVRERIGEPAPRGVWWHRVFMHDRFAIVTAVRDGGAVVERRLVPIDVSEADGLRIEAELWATLDLVDPPRAPLRLVP